MRNLSSASSTSRALLAAAGLIALAPSGFAQASRTKVEAKTEPVATEDPAAPAESKVPSPEKAGKDEAVKEPAKVVKTDAEWRRILTYDQYLVTRMKATEPAFSGRYAHGNFKGTFLCVCCGSKLFDSRHKFDSGTGWPSFWRPLTPKALEEAVDRSEAEPRIEVTCTRCGAHLGHVFNDGPAPTGLRYCINSLAIKLDSEPTRPATATRKPSGRRRSLATRDERTETPESTSPAQEDSRSKKVAKP